MEPGPVKAMARASLWGDPDIGGMERMKKKKKLKITLT
jgi:hypothetical protein